MNTSTVCIENNLSISQYFRYIYTSAFHYRMTIMENPLFKSIITLFSTFVSVVIHENVVGVGVLILLVILDQITGVINAIKEHAFKSTYFIKGLLKLFLYLVIISAFRLLFYINESVFGFLRLENIALMWLSTTETISIVENSLKILNMPSGKVLLSKLYKLRSIIASKDENGNVEDKKTDNNK